MKKPSRGDERHKEEEKGQVGHVEDFETKRGRKRTHAKSDSVAAKGSGQLDDNDEDDEDEVRDQRRSETTSGLQQAYSSVKSALPWTKRGDNGIEDSNNGKAGDNYDSDYPATAASLSKRSGFISTVKMDQIQKSPTKPALQGGGLAQR